MTSQQEDRDKTTVYLDSADHRRLKTLAVREGRPTAELIREAVSEYVKKRAAQDRPSSIGAGRSGRSNLSERSEELLKEGLGANQDGEDS